MTAEECALIVQEEASYEELANPILFASLVAKEFAKYHVEQALKAAVNNVDPENCFAYSSERNRYDDVEKSILNAYNLNNIK